MFRKSKNEKTTYGIVGIGRFGHALAMALAESGAELIVIDANEEKIREMRELTENAFVVKNPDKKALEETGIQNCDVAVVCIGEHIGGGLSGKGYGHTPCKPPGDSKSPGFCPAQ